jgi:hypothetical protein
MKPGAVSNDATAPARSFASAEAAHRFHCNLGRKRLPPVFWARKFALLLLLAIGSAYAADRARNALAEHVRAANDRYKDVSVAVSEGYAPNVACDHASMK